MSRRDADDARPVFILTKLRIRRYDLMVSRRESGTAGCGRARFQPSLDAIGPGIYDRAVPAGMHRLALRADGQRRGTRI
jgi:hypothetical protein